MKKTFKRRKPSGEVMTGTVRATDRGFAFVAPDGGGKDFFVPHEHLNGASHGDKVQFAHVKGTDDRAVILKITERNPLPLIGTVVADRRTVKVFPDDRRRPTVAVPRDLLIGARDRQKVVCEITAYPKFGLPTAKVVEILGDEGELFAEEQSIIRSFGLRTEFPEEVKKEAAKCAKSGISAEGRRDLRQKRIITIDGEDTRDMDDAVSVEKVGQNYVLGVHIADVERYVKHGSHTDGEAFARGTSVYFPDRVLPMLPEELSNGVCSLNEGEDRYALTCEITFDGEGNRINYEIYESIINSLHKTSYPQVTEALETGEGLEDIKDELKLMKELCLLLEDKGKERGEVALEIKELKIYVDDGGNIAIPARKRSIAERIIEQFMIAANTAVAEFMSGRSLPCLYRVHGQPADEKLETLSAFLGQFGVYLHGGGPKDFARALAETADKPYFNVANKVMLRSMQKAKYSAQAGGHFGLALNIYCHFTSPIRRYPDLFVHRVLKCALHGDGGKAARLYGVGAAAAADELSLKERTADEAERAVDDLYALAYMGDRLGETFGGVISGVTSHDVYCELENGIEGVIPFADLPQDDYEFFETKFLLKGKRHKFCLGDGVQVKIAACDLGRMKVIMKILP